MFRRRLRTVSDQGRRRRSADGRTTQTAQFLDP